MILCEKFMNSFPKKLGCYRLVIAPILTMPDITKSFDVYCDASKLGLGCVLMQEGNVIAYLSRQL
jgi:hypothetical protein